MKTPKLTSGPKQADREQFKPAIGEIAMRIGHDLLQEAHRLLDVLTPDELAKFSTDPTQVDPSAQRQAYRLAKTLLVAIAEEDRITWQWSAEAIKGNVRLARRLYRTRLWGTKIVVCRKIPVTIRKHHVPGRWIVFGDSIGPSFSSKAAAKRWALSIGYEVIP